MRTVLMTSVALLISHGCVTDDGSQPGVDTRSRAAALCARLEECNLLSGTSTNECTDQTESCLIEVGNRPSAEWDSELGECAEQADCEGFSACYRGVPYC